MSDATYDSVKAKEFVLEHGGEERACLKTVHRRPRLEMRDDEGRVRLEVGVGETTGPFVHLLDANGKTRAAVYLETPGAAVVLFDENGQRAAAVNGFAGQHDFVTYEGDEASWAASGDTRER